MSRLPLHRAGTRKETRRDRNTRWRKNRAGVRESEFEARVNVTKLFLAALSLWEERRFGFTIPYHLNSHARSLRASNA